MRFISHRGAIEQLKRIFNQAPIRLCLRILQGLSRGFPPRPSSFGGEIHGDDQAVIASGILELKTKRYSLVR
jgi:hypothetical protein